MSVLVTGGAGYIGSHAAHALAELGGPVIVLDNLCTGNMAFVPASAVFVQGDVSDGALIRRILKDYAVDAVMHFAASTIVPESIERPLKYYANNFVASHALVEACVESSVRNFIFSSTAAVYGRPMENPVSEASMTHPINPYGHSKLMVEWMLQDTAQAHDFRFVALRYFNVAGVDPKGGAGQPRGQASHLIKRAAKVALGKLDHLDIYGTDYPTRDGTAVRDYIHINDLVDAHLLALDQLRRGSSSSVYNCGYGVGASVREVAAAFERLTGKPLPVRLAERREGDPAEVVADSGRIRVAYGWRPRFDDLDTIVRSALQWERQPDDPCLPR
jgi:UDP-glucose 4-epimerase